jgi:hypothetical protein
MRSRSPEPHACNSALAMNLDVPAGAVVIRPGVTRYRNHVGLAVGAFLVTGIYTYVRDGVITTAGLRGSRTVELIERIGAVNQMRDEVTRLFVQDPDPMLSEPK